MHDQQRCLDRVAQLDQVAREPAAAAETLNFLAQLDQDEPGTSPVATGDRIMPERFTGSVAAEVCSLTDLSASAA